MIGNSSVAERARVNLSLDAFGEICHPELITQVKLNPPRHAQYVLRCPIKVPRQAIYVPRSLSWCVPLIKIAVEHNANEIKVHQPFIYLTIRHGWVESVTDDEWHVDGFSMRVAHVPEQNYVWTNINPTQHLLARLDIPKDFNPLIHNIHHLFKDLECESTSLEPNGVYVMDPYVVHRRPPEVAETWRTFVRLSFTPIPIADKNNAHNPMLRIPNFRYDGIAQFREKLIAYA